MNKIWAVVRRELVERVRTKAFIVSTVLFPIFIASMMVFPALMMTGGERSTRIALVDATSGGLGASIEAGLGAETLSATDDAGNPVPRYRVVTVPADGRTEAIRDSLVALTGLDRQEHPETFDGVLVVSDDLLATGQADYLGSNAGSMQRVGELQSTLSRVLMQTRLDLAGVDAGVVARALVPARISAERVSDGKPTGQSGMGSFALAWAMGFVLYLVTVIYGQQTAMSVIEEKTSRIMEVLASSLTPFQMLLGKIVGVGLTGLLQLSIWAGTAWLLAGQRAAIAGLFGADASAVQRIPIPAVPGDVLVVFLLYFALGFLIYGALFAAVGSIVNTSQDMQQFLWPVMIPVIFGFLGMFRVLNDPEATMGTVFTFIPLFAPFVVPVKYSMGAMNATELALAILTMLAGIVVFAWLAGRIYRTGILMYGKKPSFGEVLRWIRAG